MKAGIIIFPGSNCDIDCYYGISNELGYDAEFVWHEETSLPKGLDLVILPGGFSYGDYLRCGAIAKISRIMNDIIRFANQGGHIIGICNGFQILTESGLLPGALLLNTGQKFVCKDIHLKVKNTETKFTKQFQKDAVLTVPIAHGEGRFHIDDAGLKSLQDHGQVVFQYSDADGQVSMANNPNGSIMNIAGIINKNGNVLGMMPHPERCLFDDREGLKILDLMAA